MTPPKEIEPLNHASVLEDGNAQVSQVVREVNLLVDKLNELIDGYNQLIKQYEKRD